MKILVIGSKGNMGRRYMAILRYLGVDAVLGMDVGDPLPEKWEYDRAIIATPTLGHYAFCNLMIGAEKDFLCEKPIDKDPEIIQDMIDHSKGVDGRMVCNWAFACGGTGFTPGSHQVYYNNYNTGKDGLAWDCVQLIYLANGFPLLANESPFLQASIDGKKVTEADIANSYVYMIRNWIRSPTQLWSLADAKKATEKVIAYEAMVAARLHP